MANLKSRGDDQNKDFVKIFEWFTQGANKKTIKNHPEACAENFVRNFQAVYARDKHKKQKSTPQPAPKLLKRIWGRLGKERT